VLSVYTPPARPLIRFLDTVGNGTGTKNAIGNYSVTPGVFFIQPAAGVKYVLTQFTFHYSDSGGFSGAVYGSAAAALTNGILLQATVNSVTYDLLDGLPIKDNDGVLHAFSHSELTQYAGAGASMTATFSSELFETALILDGATNDKLFVTCRDDLTFLTDQYFTVRGRY
jgi:hypothetical protein